MNIWCPNCKKEMQRVTESGSYDKVDGTLLRWFYDVMVCKACGVQIPVGKSWKEL